MVSALDSGVSGPGWSPGRGLCVVFLGKTLYSHSASLHSQSWTKYMKHLDHPSPHFNDAKMTCFCSFTPSSLLWGEGGLSFQSILSKIAGSGCSKAG